MPLINIAQHGACLRSYQYNYYAFICFNGPDLFLKSVAPTSFASNHHHHIVSSFQERVALDMAELRDGLSQPLPES